MKPNITELQRWISLNLKKAQRRSSRCAKKSNNRAKARNRLGKKHLKLQRQCKDCCVKKALSLIKSADFVVYEKQVRNLVSQG